MREVAALLNSMRDARVINDYALFGAAAQMRYTEPVATLDADILVDLPPSSRLDLLAPIYDFCRSRGLSPIGEAIQVGEWPVQFIPVFDTITREALLTAETVDFEGLPFRVVRADYLAVIALSVGRPKDAARIIALLDSGNVGRAEVQSIAKRHGLGEKWTAFERRYLNG
jgi:hypothetical protein